MLYTLCLIQTQSTNECLTFQDIKTQIKNNCSFVDDYGQLSNQTYDKLCLTCTIFDIDQVPKSNCHKSLTCIKLFFDHNLIFEKFFEKYRPIIEDLYINDMNHVQNSTLFIHIKHYNLTEINFAYLNSTLKINLQPYNMLTIEFSQYMQELKPLTIASNFSLMTISNVVITIPCNVYNQKINYRIHSGKIIPTKSVVCEVSQSTELIRSTSTNRKVVSLTTSKVSRIIETTTSLKTDRNNTLLILTTTTETTPMLTVTFSLSTTITVSHTTTNGTISLSSQSSSSLLFLLSVSFIIMICIIIASMWGFFRQNNSDNHHDISDEHLNRMHNMINADKYGVTDKDSKSAASWTHGSTLLLSPFVK